jgi:hypothetical protein
MLDYRLFAAEPLDAPATDAIRRHGTPRLTTEWA